MRSRPRSARAARAVTRISAEARGASQARPDDWAYGQSAARSLATSNPTRALDNADNHEYFAENTPAQN